MKIEYNRESNSLGEEQKQPIFRKCPNQGNPCFCPGTCKEIIGYTKPEKAVFFDLPQKPDRKGTPKHPTNQTVKPNN